MENTNNIYYYVFDNQYDDISDSNEFLINLRETYFKDNSRQKNKIVQKIGNDTYRYAFCLEQGKPMKWKKMKNSKLVEKSVVNKDGSYYIVSYKDGKRINKMVHFDQNHMWIKNEYYNGISQNVPAITITRDKYRDQMSLERYSEALKKKTFINMIKCDIGADQNEMDAINASMHDGYIKIFSQAGTIIYCEEDSLEKRVTMLKELRLADEKLLGAAYDDTKQEENHDEKDNHTEDSEVISDREEDIQEVLQQENAIEKVDNFDTNIVYDELNDEAFNSSIEKMIESLTNCNEEISKYESLEQESYNNAAIEKEDKTKPLEDKEVIVEKPLYEDNDEILENYFDKEEEPSLNINLNQEERPTTAYTYQRLDSNVEVPTQVKRDEPANNTEVIYINDQAKKNKLGIYFNEASNLYYIGKWVNPDSQEKGTIIDIDGNITYIGYFKNYVKTGYGTSYNQDNKVVYKGYWENDMYNGEGTLYCSNGNTISGTFKDGKVCGFAIEYDFNGSKVYEGEWKDNVYHGMGSKTFKNGNYCKGEFVNGNLCGQMEAFDKYGNIIYKGECDNYSYNGQGAYYIDGQIVYQGEFLDNYCNGFGKKYENGSCIFEGYFKLNVKSGFGKVYEHDTLKYIGFFENDMYNGYGVLYQDDEIFVGEFLNGKKHGRVNVVRDGHVYRECIYENDQPIYANEYEEDILVYRGNILENKRNGMGCTFLPYSVKDQEGIFFDGNISNVMKVPLKDLEKLPQIEELLGTDYEKYRLAPDYVIEKDIGLGIYSGPLKDSMPDGKGTILYPDHRYIGEFKDGKPYGQGVVYKNSGQKIEGYFVSDNESEDCLLLSFDNITYYVRKN
mgnify:FL=1